MACLRRERTGFCSHHQCEYSDETPHGAQCIEIFHTPGILGVSFCEVGEDCPVKQCSYSYDSSSEKGKEIATHINQLISQ